MTMNIGSQWSGPLKRRFLAVPWALVWSLGILLLTALFVWRVRGVAIQALPYLRAANYRILAIAGIAELGFYLLLGYANQWLYRMYGRRPPVSRLGAMVSQASMINEVLPTSGLSGNAGFVYWGNRLGFGMRDSIAVSLWFMALGYVALTPLVAVCVASLGALHGAEARAVQAGLAAALGYAVLFGAAGVWSWRRSKSAGAVGVVSRGAGRAETSLRRLRAELASEWRTAGRRFGHLAACTASLLAVYPMRIVMLHLCFASVGVWLPWRTAVFAYSLTQLFATVSLSPTTLGVVDVAYATTLSWFGIALPEAIAGTVLYRIATFWWPIPLGLLSQWWLTFLARRA